MRSKSPITEAHVNLLLLEGAILSATAVVTLVGTLRATWKVKKTATQVKDVADEAVSRL